MEFISCIAVSVDFGILLTFTLNLKIESIFLLGNWKKNKTYQQDYYMDSSLEQPEYRQNALQRWFLGSPTLPVSNVVLDDTIGTQVLGNALVVRVPLFLPSFKVSFVYSSFARQKITRHDKKREFVSFVCTRKENQSEPLQTFILSLIAAKGHTAFRRPESTGSWTLC